MHFLFQTALRCLACLILSAATAFAAAPAEDVPFAQQTRQIWDLASTPWPTEAITALANGRTLAPLLEHAPEAVAPLAADHMRVATTDATILRTEDLALVAGAAGLRYRTANTPTERHILADRTIAVLAYDPPRHRIAAMGPDGLWLHDLKTRRTQAYPLPCSRALRRAAFDANGTLWIATGMGLCRWTPTATRLYQEAEEIVSAYVNDVTVDNQGRILAACLGGVSVYEQEHEVLRLTPANGLPCAETTCVAAAPDGGIWIGTTRGLARYDEGAWSFLAGRRWLPDDQVLALGVDASGTAWALTPKGLAAISRSSMTLLDKALFFHSVSEQRHVRPPGIEEKCRLPIPGDVSQWLPEDDDNDGGYTALYGVMQALRYQATGDPDAAAKARRAFEVQLLLEEVTGVPGYIARTVIPPDWEHMHDPNTEMSAAEITQAKLRDPRFKYVPVRWRLTPDGQWRWKSDTSSDEITAHFYALHMYHDLVADATEKKRVAALAARMMDYIIAGGYTLRDLDGAPTRWGVWSPEKLNHDPDWRAERGINSLEMLSYLKTAFQLTGNPRYQREYLKLIRRHGYAENARRAKTFNPAWRTHIDDELLAFAYPALFKYETDPKLRAIYRESLDAWFEGVKNDINPFFNYTYLLCTGEEHQRGDSLFFLRDCPLDLVDWTVDNTLREDLRIVRTPILEDRNLSRMLPPSERPVVRWDKNPWMAAWHGGGHTEWSPTFWLVAYWMGRATGALAAP
jgi:hypothetical protein